MASRAERRSRTKAGTRILGEIRAAVTNDSEKAEPTREEWLDAVEMEGYFYEYFVKPNGSESIYGIYSDFEHTDMLAILAFDDDHYAGAFVWA